MSTPSRLEGPHPIDALDSVRKHPEWYFRTGEFSVIEAVALLTAEALAAGATSFSARQVGEFWVLESPHDWLDGDIAAFYSLTPDPAQGPNTSRVEIVLTAFCATVWTASPGRTHEVVGRATEPTDLVDLFANMPKGRIIAFVPPTHTTNSEHKEPEPVVAGRPRLRLVEAEDLSERYDDAILQVQEKQLFHDRLGDTR
jgi:hypothetical protein